jgi:hypothetical protein
MIAEATCISKPMTIIPLVVASVQDVIAAGQILQTNQLTDMAKLGPRARSWFFSNLSTRRARRCSARQQLHCESLFKQP